MRYFIWLAAAALAAGAPLPWYMQETAMTPEGRLTFLEKPWWPRAQALAEGQSFTLDLNGDGRTDTMVMRRDGHIVEAINDSGGAPPALTDRANTAFVVSLKGTGLVDRMVVYIDNDGDGKADEMDFRHYRDGYLRYAWFAENFDPDGAQVFEINKDWSYTGNNGANKFRGNLQIFLNKYDPATRTWVPLSECPFAFWDYDHDGHGDVVFRVSAAPLASLTGPDSDYANNYNYMWAPQATPLAETGNLNVRFSFNIDPRPRHDPLNMPHYNFGFTTVGAVPYNYPHMTYTNPRRRPPQTVTRIAWKDGVEVAMNYPARQTGFTWDESRSVWRWEGQFWIYERIFMSNTGGPTHRWNMRREYSSKPADRRRIYYSEADRRYHLLGAEQGWLEAGWLVNKQKDLEFRWFDRDRDGYLDTVEVYQGESQIPARVARFDPRAHEAPLDREALDKEYNGRVLPEALAEDRALITAMKKWASSPAAEAYEAEAARTEMPERQRYCLDIARELYFLKTREALAARLAAWPYPASNQVDRKKWRSTDPGSKEQGYSLGDSLRYWKSVGENNAFEEAYSQGRLGEALRLLEAIGPATPRG